MVPKRAKLAFKGIIFDVYQWDEKGWDGSTLKYEMLKRPDTVRVIAIKDDKIVMLEEEQPHIGKFCDIPGGRHEFAEEDELQAAQRELLEETGMKFKTWKLLSVVQPLAKVEQFMYVFLATDFDSQHDTKLDAGEKITVRLMSFDEVKANYASGKGRLIPTQIKAAESLDDLLNWPEYSD